MEARRAETGFPDYRDLPGLARDSPTGAAGRAYSPTSGLFTERRRRPDVGYATIWML